MKPVLPDDWQERIKKIWAEDYTAPLYGFRPKRPQMNDREIAAVLFPSMLDDRDPLSRAALPPPDVHRRKLEKTTGAEVGKKCIQILESTNSDEGNVEDAALALIKAERKLIKAEKRERELIETKREEYNSILESPNATEAERNFIKTQLMKSDRIKARQEARKKVRDGYAEAWCRTLALDILCVARLSYLDERIGPEGKELPREPRKILAKKAQRIAEAFKVVQREAPGYHPAEIEDAIKYFESPVHRASGVPEHRTTQAIYTLTRWHEEVLSDSVDLATAALLNASFGGKWTADAVRSVYSRWLKKQKKKPKSSE